jgi:hypothetical protein
LCILSYSTHQIKQTDFTWVQSVETSPINEKYIYDV